MQYDLSNPSTTLNTTPSMMARIARKLLVSGSLILAVGLAGVVFGRNAAERRQRHEPTAPRIVWIGHGTTVVIDRPEIIAEAARPAQVEVEPIAETVEPEGAGDAEIDAEPEAEPAALTMVPDSILPRVMLMEVTAYCPCTRCCGPQAQGITASGKHVSYNDGKFVAADTRLLPFGTKLVIPGYGEMSPVEVIDRGGAIKGNKLDVFFPTHEEALQWGRQTLEVVIGG